MKANNPVLKQTQYLTLLMFFAALTYPVSGKIFVPPLEDRIMLSPIIVSGKIVEITDDIKEKRKSGNISYTDYYRTAYIQIDEVLKNDLADLNISTGDRLAIRIGPTEKRAKKMMKERQKDKRFIAVESYIWTLNKGDGGVWILHGYDTYLSTAFPGPANLLGLDQLQHVKDTINRLEVRYQQALENEIPLYEAKRKEMLSIPVTPESERKSKMEHSFLRPEPTDKVLKKVSISDPERDARYYGFTDEQGRMVITPDFTAAYDFSEGLAAIETSVWIERSMYADPAIKLSEKAPQHILAKRWGYINMQGQMVIPPLFDSAQPFQNGLARVSIYLHGAYRTNFDALIDTTGKVVLVTSNPTVAD